MDEVQTQLRLIRQSTLKANDHQVPVINQLNPLQQQLLKALRMKLTPIPIRKPT